LLRKCTSKQAKFDKLHIRRLLVCIWRICLSVPRQRKQLHCYIFSCSSCSSLLYFVTYLYNCVLRSLLLSQTTLHVVLLISLTNFFSIHILQQRVQSKGRAQLSFHKNCCIIQREHFHFDRRQLVGHICNEALCASN
jgi:hypothetical protein